MTKYDTTNACEECELNQQFTWNSVDCEAVLLVPHCPTLPKRSIVTEVVAAQESDPPNYAYSTTKNLSSVDCQVGLSDVGESDTIAV